MLVCTDIQLVKIFKIGILGYAYILKNGADMAEFGIKLMDLKLRRQISARDLISLKGVLDVVLKAIMFRLRSEII
jgi:hypothetical protein